MITVWQKEFFKLDCIKFLASTTMKIMEKSLLITKSLGLVIFSSNFFWYKGDCFVKYCTKEGGFSPLLEIGALSSIFSVVYCCEQFPDQIF